MGTGGGSPFLFEPECPAFGGTKGKTSAKGRSTPEAGKSFTLQQDRDKPCPYSMGKGGNMLDKKNKKGFTLIELMIVVVIIGILAAMAIPVFMQATSKAKQSEPKNILKQIYVMQDAYRQENETYACDGEEASAGEDFTTLGVEIMSSARYTYSITADSQSFTATATANIDDDDVVDTWQIDQTGSLSCTSNDATSWRRFDKR